MRHEGFRVLLERARDGDRGAMDQVVDRLRPHLEPLARQYADPTRPTESTTDLLQESCLRAWQNLRRFESDRDDRETFAMFRAWMAQIVRHLGLNAQRDLNAKKRIPPKKLIPLGGTGGASGDGGDGSPPPAPGQTPSAHLRSIEMKEKIREAVRGLPDPLAAEVVRMRFFEGLTIPQISGRLGLSPDRVRERYRSAMRVLRRQLETWT